LELVRQQTSAKLAAVHPPAHPVGKQLAPARGSFTTRDASDDIKITGYKTVKTPTQGIQLNSRRPAELPDWDPIDTLDLGKLLPASCHDDLDTDKSTEDLTTLMGYDLATMDPQEKQEVKDRVKTIQAENDLKKLKQHFNANRLKSMCTLSNTRGRY
jgi:hypothetical protein